MPEATRILIVEDLPTDAELAQREIKGVLAASIFQRVDTYYDNRTLQRYLDWA